MTSKGWEMQVNWRDQIRDFKYGITLSLSDNQVVIDKYPQSNQTILDKDNNQPYYAGAHVGDIGDWKQSASQTDQRDERSFGRYAQWRWDVLGSGWGAGDIMYADLNGDGQISRDNKTLADHGDLKKIGNSTPRYNFG